MNRSGSDEPLLPSLLIIFSRHHPAGAAHIRCADQSREIEERLFEVETDGAPVAGLYTVGLVVQYLCPGAMIVLVAPLDILRGYRGAVVKLDAGAAGRWRSWRLRQTRSARPAPNGRRAPRGNS